MQALVTIAGYELPEPSEYSASTSTLVDSARNVSGYVIGSVIRSDVAKVEIPDGGTMGERPTVVHEQFL